MMAFREYVQKEHDVGSHRHAPHTNSEELYRVKDRRSCALSNALSYSTQSRNRFMAWLGELEGMEDEEPVTRKLTWLCG